MAAPVFVRATGVQGGGATGGIALTTSAMQTTTGGYLFVGACHYTSGVNISAVVDTVGNTFVKAGTTQGGDALQDNEIWYTPNPITGTLSNAVIVRYTASASYRDVIQCLFSWGGTTSITYDTQATHAFPSTSICASNTLSVADEGLVIGNWVGFDNASPVSNTAGTTIMVAVPNTASCDMATCYRVFTASSGVATVQLVNTGNSTWGTRYSVVAKSFFGIAAGTSTPSTALNITLPLTGAGQG